MKLVENSEYLVSSVDADHFTNNQAAFHVS